MRGEGGREGERGGREGGEGGRERGGRERGRGGGREGGWVGKSDGVRHLSVVLIYTYNNKISSGLQVRRGWLARTSNGISTA